MHESSGKNEPTALIGNSARPFLVPRGASTGGRLTRTALLLAALSGVLQVLIFPLPGFTFLCWIALAPLLVALFRARRSAGLVVPAGPGQGFLLAYIAGVIWSFGTCYWIYHVMHIYGGLDAPLSLAILVLFCFALGVVFGLFGLILALLARSRFGLKALFLAPFIWVPLELIRGFPFDFTWDPLGTVLVGNIPLTRIATATGVYGLSCEIVLVNTAFAAAFLVPRNRRLRVLATSILVAALLQAGTLIHPPPLPADGTARLIQANIPILDSSGWTAQYFDSTLRELTALSVSTPGQLNPAEPPPDLVIWPETPAPFFVTDPRFRQAVSDVARRAHASVVVGSLGLVNPTSPHTQLYNSAALLAPNGDWTARYDKIHLVPFGEYVPFQQLLTFANKLTREVGDFMPGQSRQPLTDEGKRLGVFICYESIFPDEIRQFAAHGAQVFVNISNDGWFGDTAAPVQHLNQARMRAIENHRWLLRDTNTGITVSIDPYGRIVARAPRHTRTYLDAPYTTESDTTFYARHGNWFPATCAIISLIALVVGLSLRARTIG